MKKILLPFNAIQGKQIITIHKDYLYHIPFPTRKQKDNGHPLARSAHVTSEGEQAIWRCSPWLALRTCYGRTASSRWLVGRETTSVLPIVRQRMHLRKPTHTPCEPAARIHRTYLRAGRELKGQCPREAEYQDRWEPQCASLRR